jgi:hypothetical protein
MTHPDMTTAVAREYARDLYSSAARSRLVAIARCCQPSRLKLLIAAVRDRLAPSAQPAACC